MGSMLLGEREDKILDFLVRDYIKTAEPVSSLRIREGLKLNESPATIRNIVADLDDGGYLEQPHTSAGRVPTDAAYRYFVDNLMSEIELNREALLRMRKLIYHQTKISRFLAETLDLMSFASSDGKHFSGHGLFGLLKKPEFKKEESVLDAGYFVDHINELAEIYERKVKGGAEIFIGKENPTPCAQEFGVFYLESGDGGGKQTTILVGPKRMNYERISSYINFFLDK